MIEDTNYGLQVALNICYDEAIEKTRAALQSEGFGVLTTIDVKQTLKQKLDRDFRRYVILGACNPVLADRAFHIDLDIGLLLPCNVIVYEREPGKSTVAAIAPLKALSVAGSHPGLLDVATEADAKLRRALTHLTA